MPDTTKQLDVSADDLELISSALETQAKILRMQASAGGAGAHDKLNRVKSLLATVASQREGNSAKRPAQNGLWSMLSSLREAI